MDTLTNAMQGGVAYLLILQILVVTGLILFLIALVAKRLFDANQRLETSTGHVVPNVVTFEAKDTTPQMPSQEILSQTYIPPSEESEELREALQVKHREVETLRGKMEHLESKLLEYEILQEEIGSITALKAENQKLKQELEKPSSAAHVAASSVPPSARETVEREFTPEPVPEVVTNAVIERQPSTKKIETAAIAKEAAPKPAVYEIPTMAAPEVKVAPQPVAPAPEVIAKPASRPAKPVETITMSTSTPVNREASSDLPPPPPIRLNEEAPAAKGTESSEEISSLLKEIDALTKSSKAS